MNQLASVLTIALFVIFASLGLQRVRYNEVMSQTADRLGFSKTTFRVIGLIEIVASIALLATVKGEPGALRTVAVVATVVLIGMAGGELFHNLRRRQERKYVWPVAGLVLVTIVELVARLIH